MREQQDKCWRNRQYNDKTVSFKISIKDGKYQDSKWWYAYRDMLRVTTTTTCPHINILMWSQLIWWLRYTLLILWYVCMCSTIQYWSLQDRLPSYANKIGLFAFTFCEDDDNSVMVSSGSTLCHCGPHWQSSPCHSLLPSIPLTADHPSNLCRPFLAKQYAQCPQTAQFDPSFYPYKGKSVFCSWTICKRWRSRSWE